VRTALTASRDGDPPHAPELRRPAGLKHQPLQGLSGNRNVIALKFVVDSPTVIVRPLSQKVCLFFHTKNGIVLLKTALDDAGF
jgi:hypothetical protein